MSDPRRPRATRHTTEKPVTVAVLTVLPVETCAVSAMLQLEAGYRVFRLKSGERVEEAMVGPETSAVRVVAMRTTDRGQLSAALALWHLCTAFRPRFVAMVGVAGSIDDAAAIADVVIADSVIHYEPRRETGDGSRHRATIHPMTPAASRPVNDLLSSTWDPVFPADKELTDEPTFRLHFGPIGSGEAVITNADSELRAFLRTVNEKVLAVDTESAGFTQAYYECAQRMPFLVGWLVIRGISDRADREKGHDRHRIAAVQAAETLRTLLPFL